MASIMTVLGLIPTSGLGMILPHEHIFTDLRGPHTPGYAQADPADVVRRLRPHIEEIKAQGITALAEASTGGVGRNVRVLYAVAEATDLPIIAPTGAYRDDLIPDEVRDQSQEVLADWMVRDIMEGAQGTRIRAGFIELAASDTGLTPLEIRLLRAAAHASLRTGTAIASHTTVGTTALRQVEILEQEGLEPRRFIWVHAHAEPDVALHLRLARRGVYLEYDAIGAPDLPDGFFVELLKRAWDAHCGQRVLLSQDAGWYRPGEPDAPIRGYGYLVRHFLPTLREAGFDDAAIDAMVRENPQRALALEG
jgi:phosphotriesterase-related protein